MRVPLANPEPPSRSIAPGLVGATRTHCPRLTGCMGCSVAGHLALPRKLAGMGPGCQEYQCHCSGTRWNWY